VYLYRTFIDDYEQLEADLTIKVSLQLSNSAWFTNTPRLPFLVMIISARWNLTH